MAKKTDEIEALLADLSRERDELDAAIEDMISDMAVVPPEQRAAGDWGADGAKTKRYLDLTNRQAVVEREIAALRRELAGPDQPLH